MKVLKAMTWRLIDTGEADPAYTCALDEAIVIARSEGSVPNTLHLYSRNVPTVSIGRFQSVRHDIDLAECSRRGIRVVRRASGGGAIYTDSRQIIYALAVDSDVLSRAINPISGEHPVIASYRLVCTAVVNTLKKLGVDAEFRPRNDILVGGRKISGSAQIRRGKAVMQHGTLILDYDPQVMFSVLRVPDEKVQDKGFDSPEQCVTSLREVMGIIPSPDEVKDVLVRAFEDTFGITLKEGDLTSRERKLVNLLLREKYGNETWTFKR